MTGWCVTQLPEGLARHIHVEPNTGCWLYAGRKSGRRGEYGRAYFEGKDMQAHIAVLKFFCLEVPEGLVPDHQCVTPCCVYPGHLLAMTTRENIAKQRGPIGENSRRIVCVSGHPLSGSNLGKSKKGVRVCLACKRDRQMRYRKATANG